MELLGLAENRELGNVREEMLKKKVHGSSQFLKVSLSEVDSRLPSCS